MTERICGKIRRVPVHPSVVVGGAAVDVCQNMCLPEMTVCEEHATPCAVRALVMQLVKERDSLKEELGDEHSSSLSDQREIEVLRAVAEKRPTAAAYVRGLRATVQRLVRERDEALKCARVEADLFDEARDALREVARVAESVSRACEQGAGGTAAERVRQVARPAVAALAKIGGMGKARQTDADRS